MSQANRIQDVKEIPYPAPPWKMNGKLWMGMFKTDIPVELPGELKHLGDPHSLIVVLVRYLEGTLRYDELAFGTLTRLGPHIGIYVDYIWVTDLASLWGGRRIWGLQKNLAEFQWDDDSTVSVSDEQGPIATIQVNDSPASLPWLWTPMPGIGQLDENQWVLTLGTMWARFSGAGLHIQAWSERFGYRPANEPVFGFAAKPFRMRVPAGKVIAR